MKHRFLVLLMGVVCCALFLSGCAAKPNAPAIQPLMLGLKASGSFPQMTPGQKLIITLDANPSTGYDWGVVKYKKDLLALEEDVYVPPENARIGQGGQHRFVFRALKPGSSLLELAYYRPWEGSENAADWFQVVVEIQQKSSQAQK